jgi:transposase
MAIMAGTPVCGQQVVGGVDTHKDVHVAAVIDATGACVGTRSFPTTSSGYRALLVWMRSYGTLARVGVEGSGTYGCALVRFLTCADVDVLEVVRPDRVERRRRGKSDVVDAEQAAVAAWQQRRCAVPKDRSGMVESLRVLRMTRASAVRCRTTTMQVLRAQIVIAPPPVRAQLDGLTRLPLLHTCAGWRPDPNDYPQLPVASRIALRSLARRVLALDAEVRDLKALIDPLVAQLAPRLVARPCIGTETAGQLLVTAGENTHRIRSEAAFAMLCGVAPLPASSGNTYRHRLNRGGDRRANCALHMIALTRLRTDPATQAYAAKKQAEGHTKLETLRCLKRLIAREVYYLLPPPPPTPLTHLNGAGGSHPSGPSTTSRPCRSAGAVKMQRPTERTILTAPSTGIPSLAEEPAP